MTTQVFIWEADNSHVGHASIQVDQTYMSFWPTETAGKNDVKLNSHHHAYYPSSYAEDRDMEGGREAKRVVLHDLDEKAMQEYWQNVQYNKVKYNLVSTNCSTVVANILLSGSQVKPSFSPVVDLDHFVSGKSVAFYAGILLKLKFRDTVIWTPASVFRYARELQAASPSHP